jgi:hypothetical protein
VKAQHLRRVDGGATKTPSRRTLNPKRIGELCADKSVVDMLDLHAVACTACRVHIVRCPCGRCIGVRCAGCDALVSAWSASAERCVHAMVLGVPR